VDPSGAGELHGSLEKRHGGGEGMEAAQVELSMLTQCQWWMAMGMAAPCVHKTEKKEG
jgi:hypothetical protein